jgi:glycosyltransferase involved in cell wall biosynthesis
MHILLVHQNFAALDEPGGTRHHELARYLEQRGHRVTVITSQVSYLTGKPVTAGTAAAGRNRWAESQEQDGITILRAYTYPALHRSFVHRVLSFFSFMASSFLAGLGVRQVDLVWGTSPPIFQAATAWALARIKRVPFLLEVRDLWPAFAIAVGVLRNPTLIRLSEWLERFLYRHAERVMVNSPGFRAHVEARGAQRVELVPNGADPRMFDPQAGASDLRREHGLQGKFVVLYAGAHGLSNDLGALLEAARLLCERPEIAIVLVGDGKDKPALMEQAALQGLHNVRFLPPVAKIDMPRMLAAADACLAILKPIPLYATVYPNKVFDYMAAGKPVILAIDGVIREVVEGAGAGVFVQPGDPQAMAQAIAGLAQDPARARLMGLRGRQAVEARFDRAALAEKLAMILEEMGRTLP